MTNMVLSITDRMTEYSTTKAIRRNDYNKDEKLKRLFLKDGKFFSTELEAKEYFRRLQPKIKIKSTILFIADSSYRDLQVKQIDQIKREQEISKNFLLIGISKLVYEDMESILQNWKIKCDILVIHPKISGTLASPINNECLEKFKKVIFCLPYGTMELDVHSKQMLDKMINEKVVLKDLRKMNELGYDRNPTGISKGKHLTKDVQKFTLSHLLNEIKEMNLECMVS